MSTEYRTRRLRANPVEILILLAVTAIFGNSIYTLFYDPFYNRSLISLPSVFSPLVPSSAIATKPLPGTASNRAPASVTTAPSSFTSLEVNCDKPTEVQTTASKVRLTGALCGMTSELETATSPRLSVNSESPKFSATVFTDASTGKFSTEYIPLAQGRNVIHLSFDYSDGKSVKQEIVLQNQAL
ncbi:hypothetical protein WDW86_05340 [Bdellovibrionota bacterium FG-2]